MLTIHAILAVLVILCAVLSLAGVNDRHTILAVGLLLAGLGLLL